MDEDSTYFTSYISAACNGTPHAVAWGLNDLIAYGSCNAVHLYDPRVCRVTQTLSHHTGRVNSVQWIRFSYEPENEFITASSDKTAALWRQNADQKFEVSAVLTGHRDVVTFADAIYPSFIEWEKDKRTLLAATASADSTVFLWKRAKTEKMCGKAAVISLKTGLCLSLRLFMLGGQCPILAVGADDSSIHLYSILFKDICEIMYNKVFTLTSHDDWIRSMDFIHAGNQSLLATASQDTTIRLWRFQSPSDTSPSSEITLEGKTFVADTVNGNGVRWCVSLDSVLAGHEGWIYGVCWRADDPFISGVKGFDPLSLRLVSASLDKSMIVWAPGEDGVWLEEIRVGEVGGNTLGFYGCQVSPDGESILAHGYNGSFHLWHKSKEGDLWKPGITVGGHFGEATDLAWEPGGLFVVSLSADQTTRLHAPCSRPSRTIHQEVTFEVWDRIGMNKRHFTKLMWTPAGKVKREDLHLSEEKSSSGPRALEAPQTADPKDPLMAQLSDYAIRELLALRNTPKPSKCDVVKAWKAPVAGVQAGFRVQLEFPAPVQWHEIARPQVHGYNLQCLALLTRYRFASGAEEKVIRAFQAPANFVDNFCRLCGVEDEEARRLTASTPSGASVPSLGLSNKAVYQSEATASSGTEEDGPAPFRAVILEDPPTEEHLVQNTLWPEVQKLYGHGYELYSLAASHNGLVLASACRATTQQHAAVILWDAKSWTQIQTLPSHQLTVTQMAFSPNDRYLLTVSRDRRWSLFESVGSISSDSANNGFKLVASTNKINGLHTRVIWCCAWTHDSKYFATGSREGKVVVWGSEKKCETDSENPLGLWQPNDPVLELQGECINSLAFARAFVDKTRHLLAVGLDSGCIRLYWWTPGGTNSWNLIFSLNKDTAHHLGVKRLAFRPIPGAAGHEQRNDSIIQLASSGEDHAVKVHSFNLQKLSTASPGVIT